ncbi:uncharacterized protein LOC120439117 [Oreochromis aureus]|uniref:uncharacterized protein LOC120439117 n=1 Tax=Oreochromis aureus TaxID=47969 RepID=UPI00195435F4|nr:uncharacterized protein LOC120439117 [Oreochromis aureus]
MSKAGRRDMLTLMVMRWNQQKLDQLATSLTHRYQKATKALLTQLQNLESLKVQLAVTDSQLDEWVSDVKDWAEDSVSLTTKRRAFDIIMAIRRLEEEKKILVREMDHHWKSLSKYDDTLKELSGLFSSEIFKSSHCGLSEEGLRGLQSIILRKRHNVKQNKLHARQCYMQVLSGAKNINLDHTSDDDFYSDSVIYQFVLKVISTSYLAGLLLGAQIFSCLP